ncbi:hypothetical protein HTY52_13065 [Cupriavidus taiwanensis]|uniref:hypothetical protein n=1 Tax=Cupriavidus taiwanensis TaxID=164546 RepID=UPI001571D16D|nr:hypothetical protein [Cupriavidus taiwanensis]NSX15007.1 hypothetical protein [Cupriavidus taiwanensis]
MDEKLDLDALERMHAATTKDWSVKGGRIGAVVLGGPVQMFTNGSAQQQIAMFCGTNTTDEVERDANAAFAVAAHAALPNLIARIRELEASAESLASTLSNVDKAVRETLGIDPDADDALPELVADWLESRRASAAMGQVPEGWAWMRHPTRNGGEPIPVKIVNSPDDGSKWFIPFDEDACEFEWAERDEEWEILAVPPATGADDATRLEWLMLKTCVDDLGIEMPFGIDQPEYFKRFRAAIDAALRASKEADE